MPLNYSKWDQLELSDDSDIEGHPNVDKKSLIRWKQRDIHEKREARKARLASLAAEIACNEELLTRLSTLQSVLKSASSVSERFSSEAERLRVNPSPDAPQTFAEKAVPYDTMILKLLETIATEAKQAGGDLGEKLQARLEWHVKKLGEVTDERKKEQAELEREKNRTITSEDVKEGWDSKYVPAAPEPAPVPGVGTSKGKGKAKATTTVIETLNSPSVPASSPAATESDEEDNDLPELTPSLTEFSHLPLWDFEKSWEYIQQHRDVVVPGATDALLVAAFTAQTDGKSKYAKQCVHQSLLLQYGEKLGKDGVRLFFQRMITGGKSAHAIFRKDVEDTYAHIVNRVEVTKAEREAASSSGAEQIQLVAENPSTTISFNVPVGPPPENLVLEGPGTEDLNVEDVRKALQMRWDVFTGLPENMQEALKTGELEKVNKVLGELSVDEAENVVGMLDAGGILSFAEGGIRDETGKGDTDEEGEPE